MLSPVTGGISPAAKINPVITMSETMSLPAAPTKIVAGPLTNEQRATLVREAKAYGLPTK